MPALLRSGSSRRQSARARLAALAATWMLATSSGAPGATLSVSPAASAPVVGTPAPVPGEDSAGRSPCMPRTRRSRPPFQLGCPGRRHPRRPRRRAGGGRQGQADDELRRGHRDGPCCRTRALRRIRDRLAIEKLEFLIRARDGGRAFAACSPATSRRTRTIALDKLRQRRKSPSRRRRVHRSRCATSRPPCSSRRPPSFVSIDVSPCGAPSRARPSSGRSTPALEGSGSSSSCTCSTAGSARESLAGPGTSSLPWTPDPRGRPFKDATAARL